MLTLKQLLQLAVITIVSLLLWFVGPMLAIGHLQLLALPSDRLIIIVALFCIWGIYNLYDLHFLSAWLPRSILPRSTPKTKSKMRPDSNDETILILKSHFANLLAHINNQPQALPVYLVLGDKQAGKSTLLKHCGLHFTKIIPMPLSPTQPNATMHTLPEHTLTGHAIIEYPQQNNDAQYQLAHNSPCHFWVTKTAIFWEIPGEFSQSTEDNAHHVWQESLALLEKHRSKLPLHGTIFISSMAELVNQPKESLTHHTQALKQHLFDVQKQLKYATPLYIILSKFDLISGFREYFANLLAHEREQTLGINLSAALDNTHYIDYFAQEYNQFLGRLHAQTIRHLHAEHNLNKRNLIQEFPLQLESFKDKLIYFVHHALDKAATCNAALPQGVYFTSAIQQGVPIDCLLQAMQKNFRAQQPRLLPIQHACSKIYFTQDLFQKIIAPTTRSAQPMHVRLKQKAPRFTWQRSLVYGSATTITLAVCGLLYYQYQKDIQSLNAGQLALGHYDQLVHQTNFSQANVATTIHALQQLTYTTNLFKHPHPAALFLTTAHYDFNQIALDTYQQFLHLLFLPKVVAILQQQLISHTTTPGQLYGALKAYLMLGQPQHLKPQFILDWMDHYWQQQFGNKPLLLQQLHQNLLLALTQHFTPIKLNMALVSQARSTLNTLPQPLLVYLMLKELGSKTHRPFMLNQVLTHKNSVLTDTLAQGIPYLYTTAGFRTVFLKNYVRLSRQLIAGDWVLTDSTQHQPQKTVPQKADPQKLAQQVAALYMNDYVDWWSNHLDHLQLQAMHSLPQLETTLAQLTGPQSPLLGLLQVIKLNTDLNSRLVNTAKLQQRFGTLNQLLTKQSTASPGLHYATIAASLKQLQRYLPPLNDAQQGATAFKITVGRFQPHAKTQADPITQLLSLAKQAPQPLQSWLTRIAKQAWQLLVQQTTTYINQIWQTQIVSFYAQHLQHRYPLFSQAKQDISLQNFSQFFATHGLLHAFFSHYVSPFVDTSKTKWQWRQVDGKHLPFNANVLTTFERARIIRLMFFHDNPNKIGFNFTLQQIALEPIVKSIKLDINGETLLDKKGNKNISSFIWPGNSAINSVHLLFNDVNGQHFASLATGPWAFLRLVAKSDLHVTRDPRKYTLLFSIDGNGAKYQLVTDNVINPFIPGILDDFRLPKSLG